MAVYNSKFTGQEIDEILDDVLEIKNRIEFKFVHATIGYIYDVIRISTRELTITLPSGFRIFVPDRTIVEQSQLRNPLTLNILPSSTSQTTTIIFNGNTKQYETMSWSQILNLTDFSNLYYIFSFDSAILHGTGSPPSFIDINIPYEIDGVAYNTYHIYDDEYYGYPMPSFYANKNTFDLDRIYENSTDGIIVDIDTIMIGNIRYFAVGYEEYINIYNGDISPENITASINIDEFDEFDEFDNYSLFFIPNNYFDGQKYPLLVFSNGYVNKFINFNPSDPTLDIYQINLNTRDSYYFNDKISLGTNGKLTFDIITKNFAYLSYASNYAYMYMYVSSFNSINRAVDEFGEIISFDITFERAFTIPQPNNIIQTKGLISYNNIVYCCSSEDMSPYFSTIYGIDMYNGSIVTKIPINSVHSELVVSGICYYIDKHIIRWLISGTEIVIDNHIIFELNIERNNFYNYEITPQRKNYNVTEWSTSGQRVINTISRGIGNTVWGHESECAASGAMAGGLGGLATAEAQISVGKYPKRNDNCAFIYGNGTNVNNRHNLIEIYSDGSIRINEDETLHFSLTELRALKNLV